MAELQNANPVILNAAQLPSRRLGKDTAAKRGPEFKFDSILAPKTKAASGAVSPWAVPPVSPPSPLSSVSSGDAYDDVDAFGDDDGDVFTEEPIDEQEIYGTFFCLVSCYLSCCSAFLFFPFSPGHFVACRLAVKWPSGHDGSLQILHASYNKDTTNNPSF